MSKKQPNRNSRTSLRSDARIWRDTCRAICDELRPAVNKIAGTPRAAKVVVEKGAGGDETTFVDALAERIIIKHLKALQKQGRKFSLLIEETGLHDFGAPYPRLVVDPVDGSVNCKRGIPMYAFSLGVYEGPTVGTGSFGYVMNLANGDEFYASSDRGCAWFNNKRLSGEPDRRRKSELILFELSAKKSIRDKAIPFLLDCGKQRCLGSLALALAYAAAGKADIYVHFKNTRMLDYAGAKIVMEAAGGRMVNENGSSLDDVPVDLGKYGMFAASRSTALVNAAVRAMQD